MPPFLPRSPQDDLLPTDFGVEALYEAAADRGISTASWPSPADGETLVSFLLARESHPQIATVLSLARIRVGYRGPAAVRLSFLGRDEGALPDSKRLAPALESEIVQALVARGFPGKASVVIAEDELTTHIAVVLPSRWIRVVAEAENSVLAYRTSVASVTFVRGLLDVAAAHPLHASILVAALGVAAFADARFFSPAPLVALRGLQHGSRAFKVPAAFTSEIARIRMIEALWDSGHSVNLSFSGADVPKEMEKLGLHIEGGELLATTLRFNFNTAPHQADVALRPPNELTCSEPLRAPVVFACLEAKGILARHEGAVDLWSLDPWVPSDRAARAFFGKAFEAFVEEKILAPARSRAVVHPDYPASGRRLIAFPIPREPGRWYGASDGFRIPARTLEEKDLVSWRLKLIPLGRRIARALGLKGKVRLLERRGVIDLGTLRIGPATARFFLLTRLPLDAKALAERLRLLAMPAHVVLLVPPTRTAGTSLAEVKLAHVAGPYDALLGDAARALGLADQVDPIHLAPPGTRLVLHVASKRVWFDGVLIHPLREQAYRLVEILAKLGGAVIEVKELGEKIAGAHVEGTTAQAKHGLKLAIEASFEREGRKVPEDAGKIVESARRGEVRLGVTVFVG